VDAGPFPKGECSIEGAMGILARIMDLIFRRAWKTNSGFESARYVKKRKSFAKAHFPSSWTESDS
jgi:hypothetical protein